MKRILSVVALMIFAGPSLADDKAKIKELEDRLSKVEAAISWKTTEPKPLTVGCDCGTTGVCTCGTNCKCVTPQGFPAKYTFNGVPHVWVNGSYHPHGKVSTAAPLSSSAPVMSSGVRVVTSGTGYPVHTVPQYHGGTVHFTQFGCANGRCGR